MSPVANQRYLLLLAIRTTHTLFFPIQSQGKHWVVARTPATKLFAFESCLCHVGGAMLDFYVIQFLISVLHGILGKLKTF